jgi:hypothetical protein
MITALLTVQLSFSSKTHVLFTTRIFAVVVLAFFAAGYAYSSFHVIQALRPRTVAPSGHNRFAFPVVASRELPFGRDSVAAPRGQAEEVAKLLANLALVKHRHVRQALNGVSALFAGGLLLLLITGVS